ncbi:Uncharacterised protein [Comamonas aquatica]|uniref:hypothetical protein n=1 Tax=Comamonas aquatica TaxID=225991 RepID=UPI001EF347E2|nr:hypothetical protein [Comamonas aquatica]CAB5646417.1 Uncharacterised protein [Comamonas aquatica]CAC9169414.1 Uncharacterised protein [Comamonas aquatica]
MQTKVPETVQEMELMANDLAREMYSVLEGRTFVTGVLLQALMVLHRGTVRGLPVDAQRDIGFAMAAYAGELMATPHAQPEPRHEAHQLHLAIPTPLQ